MTDNRFEITRRQILASTGAIGLAGAGAGLGTSGFLNDSESFERNTIAAGNLDLTVDWEEHYSYPQLYGMPDPTADLDNEVYREDPDEEGYVGFPDPQDPMVWIHEDDVAAYMDATAIEAFPDPDDDGSQEVRSDEQEFVYEPCTDGANLPEHLDPAGLRTDNADTRGPEGGAAPLVNLADVKPGDFGEFTLSFHLCGNPGYVWLQAAGLEESENGLTDPEGEVDNTAEDAELAEHIQTAWWYDTDGNNVIDESIGAVDVMIAVDTSGSLTSDDVTNLQASANQLASDLDAMGEARVGGLSFGDGSIDDFTPLDGGPAQFSGLSASGNTPMPAALDIAAAELDDEARADAETYVVMFTDGGPNYENTTYSAGGHTVGGGYTGGDLTPSGVVHDSELCETASVAATIRQNHSILTVGIDDDGNPTGNSDPEVCEGNPVPSLSAYLQNYIAGGMDDYFQAEDTDSIDQIVDSILQSIAMPETVFHRGTLAEDLSDLTDGKGQLLDTVANGEGDPCFQPGVTNYVGFAWWLPLDVGNEIQSDSVSFDLGFYAEQCRNNDVSNPT